MGGAASWFFHEIARAFCASFLLALADRGESCERAERVMSPPILLLFGIWTLPQQGGRENGVGRVTGLRVVPSHISDRAFRNTIYDTW